MFIAAVRDMNIPWNIVHLVTIDVLLIVYILGKVYIDKCDDKIWCGHQLDQISVWDFIISMMRQK